MYIALFLVLIFYDAVEACVPLVNYWDELTTCIVVCWGGYSLWRNPRMRKGEWMNWLSLILLVAIGILGNIVHPGLQTNPVVLIKDMLALCKLPAIFLILERRTISEEKQKEMITVIAKISRWIVVATLLAVGLGYFVDLGFYTGEIRIVPTFEFVFSHPTFFISSYVMIAAALMAESVNKNRLYLLLDCFLIFMAQRSKGYIFIVFLLLIILLGEERITKVLTTLLGSEKKRVKPVRVLFALLLVAMTILIVGKSRLEEFFQLGLTVPRTLLHAVGIKILIDFFPLGSGFGTFASHLSGRYYSNIYELYGIDHIWGITKEKYHFISDVFWPYIYGQFGIFGLLLYLKLIVSIFFRQYRSKLTDGSRIALAAVWIYALIATTSEAYLTNGTGVQMALFLTIFIGYGMRSCEQNSTEGQLA